VAFEPDRFLVCSDHHLPFPVQGNIGKGVELEAKDGTTEILVKPSSRGDVAPTEAPTETAKSFFGARASKAGPPCPETNANWLSKLLFAWPGSLMAAGWQRPLVDTDMWELDPSDDTTMLSEKFEVNIKEKPNLLKVLPPPTA
jgi:hypothetical protein